MTIEQLLDTKNSSNIALSQIQIKVDGIQYNSMIFRNECEGVCNCCGESKYYDDNFRGDCECYCC